MIIASTKQAPRELIPADNYIARCYQMVQIGTVIENIKGDIKTLSKVRIGWELPTELKVFKEENGEQPLVVSEEYTLSLAEKSNLRKMLASWRGKEFTVEEAEAFDLTVLLGQPCMINIIHKPAKSDPSKIYANIGSISRVPKGMAVPKAINPVFELSYDQFDFNKYNTLPDFIKNKMATSVEYKALTAIEDTGHEDGLPAPARGSNGNVTELIDDLPF